MEIADFLQTIRSSSKKTKYKIQHSSPLRYAGGKSRAIGLILEHFPVLKEKKVVSPFFGGGSLEIILAQKLGFKVIGYDIFGLLVNFWNQLLIHPHELSKELEKLHPTKEDFVHHRAILFHYWNKIKPKDLIYRQRKPLILRPEEETLLDDDLLKQAAYFYYNMALSYGPMFLGWASSVYLQDKRYNKIVQTIRSFRCPNLEISCASFEEILPQHSQDFLFLDPPYYLGDHSKMFKGMYPNCNFPIYHKSFNHELLRDLLKEHQGGFFMTYNDCPLIREWYKDYQQVFPHWHYSYGQGETRIGKNREGKGDNVKESHEIFIIGPPP